MNPAAPCAHQIGTHQLSRGSSWTGRHSTTQSITKSSHTGATESRAGGHARDAINGYGRENAKTARPGASSFLTPASFRQARGRSIFHPHVPLSKSAGPVTRGRHRTLPGRTEQTNKRRGRWPAWQHPKLGSNGVGGPRGSAGGGMCAPVGKRARAVGGGRGSDLSA